MSLGQGSSLSVENEGNLIEDPTIDYLHDEGDDIRYGEFQDEYGECMALLNAISIEACEDMSDDSYVLLTANQIRKLSRQIETNIASEAPRLNRYGLELKQRVLPHLVLANNNFLSIMKRMQDDELHRKTGIRGNESSLTPVLSTSNSSGAAVAAAAASIRAENYMDAITRDSLTTRPLQSVSESAFSSNIDEEKDLRGGNIRERNLRGESIREEKSLHSAAVRGDAVGRSGYSFSTRESVSLLSPVVGERSSDARDEVSNRELSIPARLGPGSAEKQHHRLPSSDTTLKDDMADLTLSQRRVVDSVTARDYLSAAYVGEGKDQRSIAPGGSLPMTASSASNLIPPNSTTVDSTKESYGMRSADRPVSSKNVESIRDKTQASTSDPGSSKYSPTTEQLIRQLTDLEGDTPKELSSGKSKSSKNESMVRSESIARNEQFMRLLALKSALQKCGNNFNSFKIYMNLIIAGCCEIPPTGKSCKQIIAAVRSIFDGLLSLLMRHYEIRPSYDYQTEKKITMIRGKMSPVSRINVFTDFYQHTNDWSSILTSSSFDNATERYKIRTKLFTSLLNVVNITLNCLEEVSVPRQHKTAICKHWKQFGKCDFGDGCRFKHPPLETLSTSASSQDKKDTHSLQKHDDISVEDSSDDEKNTSPKLIICPSISPVNSSSKIRLGTSYAAAVRSTSEIELETQKYIIALAETVRRDAGMAEIDERPSRKGSGEGTDESSPRRISSPDIFGESPREELSTSDKRVIKPKNLSPRSKSNSKRHSDEDITLSSNFATSDKQSQTKLKPPSKTKTKKKVSGKTRGK